MPFARGSWAIVGVIAGLAAACGGTQPGSDAGADGRPGSDAADIAALDTGVEDTGGGTDVAPVPVDTPDVRPPADAADARPDAAPPRCGVGIDSDGDGLNNDAECAAGTDPFNPDSDMDGVTDGGEARYPRVCVATDRARQRRPPPPCMVDAMCMTGERCLGLDPRNRDSDMDGVPDGAEDMNSDGRVDVSRGETDPRLFDTDGDGASDGMSGIAICRRSGLATVVQSGLPGAPTQVGFDPAWGSPRRLMGTMMRSAVVLDDATAGVSAGVFALPSMGDVNAEATRVQNAVVTALGAMVTPVFVGRPSTTHEMNPAVSSTYRVARMATASALRDAVVMGLVGAAAPGGGPVVGSAAEFLVDVTTVRRTMGRSANTTDVIVTVAPRALLDDRARVTAIRAIDLSNATGVAESDRGLGYNCQTFRGQAAPLVDFVMPTDVSPSMGPHQVAVGNTATQLFADFNAAGVDFRVAVIQAQPRPFDFVTPGLTWTGAMDVNGARDLAFRVTVERYMANPLDMLAPYPNMGMYTLQLNEEPLAAGVIAWEQLTAGAMMAGTPITRRFRPGARVAMFFIADETGRNDDTRYFAMDTARWGATYPARIASAINFFRTNNILTFGLVNDALTACSADDSRDMRKCLILGNGGAYLPITTATPADVSAAMARIVAAVIGATSPYRLTSRPITSTLKVRVRGTDVPRSRVNGFDYDAVSNSVVFYGATHRPRVGDEVVVSYRLWQPCPGVGGMCVTDGECCAPQVCVAGRCSPPCTPLGGACRADMDCCAPNACIMGRCAPPVTCRPLGATCAANSDCCPPNECRGGMCSPPCRPVGGMCTTASDCCSGACTGGRCAPPPCRPSGGMCTSPADCCSNGCFDGLCAPG